jgi:transcriptional regulator with XRE-family HTH domain
VQFQTNTREVSESAGLCYEASMAKDAPKITPETCRAARALLGWNQATLAAEAGVSVVTVKSYELGKTTPIPITLDAFARALGAAGVELIADDDEKGAGVRFSQPRGRGSEEAP